MDEIKQQVVILYLLDAMTQANSWCGETHLQKSIYFLQEGLGVPLDLQFVLYKHGPYSFQLHDLLGEMKANMLVDLKTKPYPYGPSLVTTENGQTLANRFPVLARTVGNEVGFVSKNVSTRKVGDLEKMCTALFISKKQTDRSDIEIAKEVVAIKPHIQQDEALQALNRVRELIMEARK